MKKLLKVLAAFVILLIILLSILFIYAPSWYLESENKNFRKMRAESLVDCNTMPYHCAVRADSMEMFDRHIASGKNIEIKSPSGQTALFWTVFGTEIRSIDLAPRRMDPEKRTRFIDKLLAAGADVHSKNIRGRTLLHAAMVYDLKTVKKLVEAGANVNQLSNDAYYYLDSDPESRLVSPLYAAVRIGDEEKVNYLIKAGADINTLSIGDRGVSDTALNFSAKRNNVALAKLLLDAGANPDTDIMYQGKPFGTALHSSVNKNYLQITQLLLEAGANPNKLDFYDQTPLYRSAYNKEEGITKLLLKHGVNTALRDGRGRTALEYIRFHKSVSKEIERLLEESH